MRPSNGRFWLVLAILLAAGGLGGADAQQPPPAPTSYMPVDIKEPFASIMSRMVAAKPQIARTHNDLLTERYDLSDRPISGATMSRGKPLQGGVRAKLASGTTWENLAAMSPDEIRDRGLFPKGFYPLPHPNHPEGGMVFPRLT
jgi:cytochrome c peroxidase